jgi:hypothetical protein
MAHEHGMPGAWKAVRRMIERDAADCGDPEELARKIAHTEAERPRWLPHAEADVAAHTATVRKRVIQLRAELVATRDAARRRVAPDLERVQHHIAHLESETFYLLRWFNGLFRLPQARRRLTWLVEEPARAALRVDQSFAAAKAQLVSLERYPEVHLTKALAVREQRLKRLRAAAASQEHAGAVAECHVARELVRRLSNEYHVFHDVHVETSDWVFDKRMDAHRRTAQIDHVVVDPSGFT